MSYDKENIAMKYEEMLRMIDGYIVEVENGWYIDKKWLEIMRVCKRLLEKEIQIRNDKRVSEEGGNGSGDQNCS